MNKLLTKIVQLEKNFQFIPHSLIAFVARFTLAATFWQSGQSKIQGLAINLVQGEWVLGWPRLADGTIALFRDEYRLPLIPPEWAANLATVAEHVLPLLLLAGLFTRWAALGLLLMTLTIQLLVYPGAWLVHGLWATGLLFLMVHGPGRASMDFYLPGLFKDTA